MKKFALLIFSILFSIAAFSQTLAPTVYASAGDYFVGSNGSLSWTLGEAVIETFSNDGNTLTQGFQQSTYQVVAIEDMKDVTYDVFVYPIPASDFLNIDISSSDKTVNLKMELFDVNGNKIFEKNIESSTFHENVILSKYNTNMFMLKITNMNNQSVKTFKIVKMKV
jgi:hypothetical protein